MGAGASTGGATLTNVAPTLDKEACQQLFLDQIVDFDELKL